MKEKQKYPFKIEFNHDIIMAENMLGKLMMVMFLSEEQSRKVYIMIYITHAHGLSA